MDCLGVLIKFGIFVGNKPVSRHRLVSPASLTLDVGHCASVHVWTRIFLCMHKNFSEARVYIPYAMHTFKVLYKHVEYAVARPAES